MLPSELSDPRCDHMHPLTLLTWLNTISSSDVFDLTPCLENFLRKFISDGMQPRTGVRLCTSLDVGFPSEGPFPTSSRSRYLGISMRRRRKDLEMRRKAIRGSQIANPQLPLRREWDLYSTEYFPTIPSTYRPILRLYLPTSGLCRIVESHRTNVIQCSCQSTLEHGGESLFYPQRLSTISRMGHHVSRFSCRDRAQAAENLLEEAYESGFLVLVDQGR